MNHLQRFIVLFSVLVLAAMHFPVPIFGQTTLAVRGGLGWATLNDDDAEVRTGIRGGAFATIPIQNTFGLQIGGNYVQKGANVTDADARASLKLDYIEFSGLGMARFSPDGGSASVYVLAGPVVGFNVKCAVSISTGGASESLSCDDFAEIFDEDINIKPDVGLTGGVGTEIAISDRMTLSAELQYTLGLLSVTDEEDAAKNRVFALQVGVGFPIGD